VDGRAPGGSPDDVSGSGWTTGHGLPFRLASGPGDAPMAGIVVAA
jgi:hypothetical protein